MLRFDTSGVERVDDLPEAHSIKVAAEDFFYDFRFLGDDLGKTVLAFLYPSSFAYCIGTLLLLKLCRTPHDTFLLMDSDSAWAKHDMIVKAYFWLSAGFSFAVMSLPSSSNKNRLLFTDLI